MALKANARDRIGRVTGSIMYWVAGKGTPEETNEVFLRCVGELPPIKDTYAMRLGAFVEPYLIKEWERASGLMVCMRQEEVSLPALPDDVFVTLDGMTCDGDNRIVTEFKFLSPFTTKDEIFYRYYDQVALAMMCANADSGKLIVGQGTNELLEIECLRDDEYELELLARIRAWLACVKSLTPPHPIPMPKPPPERWRRIDLDVDTPNWRGEMLEQLSIYSATAQSVGCYEAASKAARALVPDDVELVLAPGYRIGRDKRGILAIRRRA